MERRRKVAVLEARVGGLKGQFSENVHHATYISTRLSKHALSICFI